jgi:NADPH-dependent 7-cyano-7-deazaguanine reductase QueF-like protein
MIKEKDLIELGFKRKDNTPESSGAPDNWHYYTLDIGDLSLISDDSDVVEDNNWKVYIFDYDGFQFTEVEKLKLFIDILNEIKI